MRQDVVRSNAMRRRWFIALAALILAAWAVWSQWDWISARFSGTAEEAGSPEVAEAAAVSGAPDEQPSLPGAETDQPLTAEQQVWADFTGQAPVWPEELSDPTDCPNVNEAYTALCARMESLPAIRDSEFSGGVCGLLVNVADELADRPPEAGSELKNHALMVSNTFHLFRVLGRKKINVLRKLAADEALVEPMAMVLWQKFASQQRCLDLESPVRVESLYDYAAFGFQTLGGQAYMRRRSPRQEALAAFYGLLALDRALAQNHNPQGVDPRPEIRRTRELLKGRDLMFEAQYIELLDEMALRFDRGSPGGRR